MLPHPVLEHPPVSLLGFDPVIAHPTLDEFKGLISKKKGTVKGMIMDQAFSAGVGNVSQSIFLTHGVVNAGFVATTLITVMTIFPSLVGSR